MADFSEKDSRLSRVHNILEDIASSISLLSEAKREDDPTGVGDDWRRQDLQDGPEEGEKKKVVAGVRRKATMARRFKGAKTPEDYTAEKKADEIFTKIKAQRAEKADKKDKKDAEKKSEFDKKLSKFVIGRKSEYAKRQAKGEKLGIETPRKEGEGLQGAKFYSGSMRGTNIGPGSTRHRPSDAEPSLSRAKLLLKSRANIKAQAGGPPTGSAPPVPSLRNSRERIMHDIRRMHRQTIAQHARTRDYGPLPTPGTEPHRGNEHARYWRDNKDDEERPTRIRHADRKHSTHAHGYHVDRKTGKVVHSSGHHHEFANRTTFKPTSDDAMLHTDNSKTGARGSADQSEFLIKGHDVNKNPLHKWFRMSKKGGLPSAMASLGAAYHDGGDVKKRAIAVARKLSFPGADGSMVKVRPTGDLHDQRKVCMKGRKGRLHPAGVKLKMSNPNEFYRLCKGAHGPSGTPDRDEYHRGFNPKHAHLAKLHQLHVAALHGKASKPTRKLIGRHGTNAQRAAEAAGKAANQPVVLTPRAHRRREMRREIGKKINAAVRTSAGPTVAAKSSFRGGLVGAPREGSAQSWNRKKRGTFGAGPEGMSPRWRRGVNLPTKL